MRPWFLALALVVVGLAAAWFLRNNRAARPEADVPPSTGHEEQAPRPAEALEAPPLLAAKQVAPGAGRSALVGRVTDALGERAASRCRVVALRVVEGGAERRETVAGTDGQYAFPDLRPGPWRAFAVAPDRAPGGAAQARPEGYDPLRVDLEAGRTSTLDLVLEAAAVATGRVLDADGEPYPGATVTALLDGWPRPTTWRPAQTWFAQATTDADGAYRIDSIPDRSTVMLEATAPDRLPAEQGPHATSAAAPIHADFRFADVRFVDVTVVDDATGDPVARAEVTGWFPRPHGWKGFDDAWITDERGRVRAGPFPVGPVKVSARPPKRFLFPPDSGLPVPVEQVEAVIRLVGGATAGKELPPHPLSKEEMRWAAHVVGADGREIPRGWTRAYHPYGGGGGGIVDGWSDLRLREVSADHWVEAFDAKTADDEPLPYGPVRLRPAEGPPTEFVLPPERAIEGRVVGPDGEGVSDVLVLASPDWWREWRTASTWQPAHSTARTDRSGAFRIGRLADTEYDLDVRPPPSLSRGTGTVARAGAKGVTIQLQVTRRSSITILDDHGAPVADAVIRTGPKGSLERGIPWPPGVEIVRNRTDVEGRVALDAVDATQAYDLAVDPPPGRPELKPPAVRLWRGDDVTVRLDRRWWIRGVVRTPSGAPDSNVDLLVADAVPKGTHGFRMATGVPLAEDGSFSIERATADPVRLIVKRRGTPWKPSMLEEGTTVLPGTEGVVLIVDP